MITMMQLQPFIVLELHHKYKSNVKTIKKKESSRFPPLEGLCHVCALGFVMSLRKSFVLSLPLSYTPF